MRAVVCCAALAVILTGSLFAVARAVPAAAFTAYSDELATSPQNCLGCGCPGCNCISCG
jgi:ABC-type phosphate transport system permease subunit